MITEVEGDLIREVEKGEPYEYFTVLTEKEVTGTLRERVLTRVGLPGGRVTSLEDSTTTGTCEICGGHTEGIKLFVNGEEVYSGEEWSGMDTDDPEPNPFIKLNKWLEEKEISD